MIKDKTALQLQGIASSGGSLEVDGSSYTALQLQGIAHAGKTHNAKLVVHNSHAFTALQMQGISNANPGNVTFK